MKTLKIIILSFIAVTLFSISSCKKEEGEGGKASITGKIWVKRYNEVGTPMPVALGGEYAGAYEDVYIIYGDDATYGDRVQANPEGVYEFKYLRPGSYRIYAYSSGGSLTTTNRVAVIKNVTISDKKQKVECETIEIAK